MKKEREQQPKTGYVRRPVEKPPPKPLSPREMMLNSVISDFTYKPPNAEQRGLLQQTQRVFEAFESQVESVISEVEDHLGAAKLREAEYYHDYRTELKRAVRWCNTGIANDYPVEAEPPFEAQEPEYPGPITGSPPRVNYCEMINLACFTAITQLVQFVPIGRGLSIARTAMQDVRGALLDLINKNWKD